MTVVDMIIIVSGFSRIMHVLDMKYMMKTMFLVQVVMVVS